MSWNVLVVDDDLDVHAVTKLILKNKQWRDQKFEISHAYSMAQAADMIDQDGGFHVVLVDVVMEAENSGLELCELIRQQCPRSTRIILRTGQAGLVPEEEILNEYDIDYYLHKSDVTPERLFAVVRACLRSSQDISTLLAYGKQLQSFTRTLQYVSTVDDLVVFMREALRFLELKHNCRTVFAYDLSRGPEATICEGMESEAARADGLKALNLAHQRGERLLAESLGPAVGLDSSSFAIIFEAREESSGQVAADSRPPIPGGIVFSFDSNSVSTKARNDLASDARLFIENWCIAFSTLRLRDRLTQEQTLRNQMYKERLESIAAMVTGVAHELNTPLGVARTAGSMVVDLVHELDQVPDPVSDDAPESDLHEAVRLMIKNLDRAHRLIQSFRQLSSSQLSDARMTVGLRSVIEDCAETMAPELRKSNMSIEIEAPELENDGLEWTGYPGHLSQVIINLLQNAIRYAYDPGMGGTVRIELERMLSGGFRIQFIDYGKGVDAQIKPRIFDAFVTSGREHGGTGLGLAIVQNIITNLLDGSIVCESQENEGTCFRIELPEVCLVPD
nr:hybrid sensor histidine kinase/response regulator [Streptomyces chartreusis]